MLGYLSEPKDHLGFLKGGMGKNQSLWTDQTVTIASVDEMLARIETQNREVENAKQELAQKISDARAVSNEASLLAEKIENLASGFHAGSDAKLLEYNIKPRKAKGAVTVPETKLIPTIEDDTDGEGFIVSSTADPVAKYYEWQKGKGVNAADKNTIPEMTLFKTTQKTYFVDDDVPKGVRMFYKVRACNAAGFGPWSEPVSRVQ